MFFKEDAVHLFNSEMEWPGGGCAPHGQSYDSATRDIIRQAENEAWIWDQMSGGNRIQFDYLCGVLIPTTASAEGWRDRENGTREFVQYYFGWGWLTLDERFDLRQSCPRIAP